MALPEYPRVAQFRGDVPAWITNISAIVNGILRGRQNVVGEVTLDADDVATTTTVTEDRCHKYSSIILDPLSLESAALLATGQVCVLAADRTEGQFIITHPPIELGAERSFYYTIEG